MTNRMHTEYTIHMNWKRLDSGIEYTDRLGNHIGKAWPIHDVNGDLSHYDFIPAMQSVLPRVHLYSASACNHYAQTVVQTLADTGH